MPAEVGGARDRVAAAARRLADERLVLGTAGNVSERVGESVAITPTACLLEALAPEDVVVVDMAGKHVEGDVAASSELELHLGIYRRYDAGAVVHTHAPFATAVSCVLDELPVVHYQMLALGGAVRVVRYATFGTSELAALTLDGLQDRSAALMSNHGAITYGPDVATAVDRMLLLEWACDVYWHAAALGAPRTLDREQQAAFLKTIADRGYGGPTAGISDDDATAGAAD